MSSIMKGIVDEGGTNPFQDGYMAWKAYLDGETKQRPHNPYPAGEGMHEWEMGAARAAEHLDWDQLDEDLRKWFKEKWVRFGPDGKIRGACARGSDSEGKPKCLPQKKAHALGKKGRKYAASKKRREDPNPERRGKAKNVATKKKTNEGIPFNECPECRGPIVHESMMNEKKDACYHKVKARYKVWPSAYASGALVQCRKKGASNWGTGGKKKNESSVIKGIVDESTNFVTENILTEGKILLEGRVVRKLWESAGQKIVEAQLTPQQIQQIFQAAEKGQTQAGGNRTIAGKGVDAASAVNRAWEDLKTKVQNSGPIQNMDAMYDKAAEALKNATGGDQGAMAYVQKYRDFAAKHPVAQSFLYAALIAAAGVSGAGAGGAAALGLLKMTDKLLQGQKFSSAAYSGAKTGGLAYAAGQIGQQMKAADAAQPVQVDQTDGFDADAIYRDLSGADVTDPTSSLPQSDPDFKDFSSMVDPDPTPSLPQSDPDFKDFSSMVEPDEAEKAANAAKTAAAKAAKAQAAAGMNEGVQLSKYQVFSIMEAAIMYQTALNEGLMDKIKGAASKVGQYAATKGHNITTKITADKLLQAWKKAGSPTDSQQVKAVLKSAGVTDQVIATVMPVQATIAGVQPKAPTGTVTSTMKATIQPAAAPAQAAQPTSAIGQGIAKTPNANVNPELQKRLAARKAGKPVYAGGLEEGVIVSHDAKDPEVAILGGAGTMSLSRLKKKAQAEANMLANDLAKGAFKSAAYNIKQLENSLATIKAAEEEMEKKYFGEDTDMRYAAEKTPEINPYGGQRNRKFRGAISETPTDNPTGASGEGGWRTYKPKSAGTVEEDTAYATGMGQGGNAGQSYRKFTPKSAGTFKEDELDEACWKGYHKEGNKKMFGKTYPNCVKNTNEEEQLDEKCWDSHKQVGMKKKGDKMVPNCVPKESAIMKGLTGKRD